MDNFRKYRSRTNYLSTTDGFIRASKSRTINRQQYTTVRATSPEKSRIGNFQAPDGFNPVDLSSRSIGQPAREFSDSWHKKSFDKKSFDDEHKSHRRHRHKYKKRAFGSTKHQEKKRLSRRIISFLIFNPFKKRNWNKRRVFAHCAITIFIIGGIFGARLWWLANKIFQGGGGAVAMQENVDPSMLRGEGDGRINILLLGRGGGNHDGPDLTDTIVIASINPIQDEAALLSIPRDLYVRTSNGGHTKINAIFANAKDFALSNMSASDNSREDKADSAGMVAIENIIKTNIGIPIHYHGIIDFDGFARAIDTVGGVDVDVPQELEVYEPSMWLMGRSYTLNVTSGWSHFDGIRALAFSRSRETSSGGDFDRSKRQRLLLVALKDKIFSAGTYGNPIRINQLMSDFGNHIKTNLSLNEIKRLYEIINEIPSNKIDSVDLVTPPNDLIRGKLIAGSSVQIPKAGIDNFNAIKSFIRNRLKDGYLAHENASVAIYNGTMIDGLASRTSDDLKSYGYNITRVADTSNKGLQRTIVVDLRNGEKKYTKHYLEKRFGTSAVERVPSGYNIDSGNADFVIILGQNEQTRLAN